MSTGTITTFAGIGSSGMSDDGLPAASAALADPIGLYIDASGVMFEVDQSSFRVRKITPPAAVVPPATPSGFTAVTSGPNSAQLSWNAVPGATGYIAKVSLSPGAQKVIVTTTTSTLIGVPGLAVGQPYYFVVSAANAGGQSADSPEQLVLIPKASVRPTDMDGDGSSDLIVWRPSNGTWFWLTSSSGYNASTAGQVVFGGLGDTPLTGDVDGDGRADLIVWRASTGSWYWLKSSRSYNPSFAGQMVFGGLGDVPLIGDIDGDGKADLIVWRPSTGMWYWLSSSSGYTGGGSKQFGSQSVGDIPMLADVDGDGRSDVIVWRASTGTFYWLTSSSSYTGGGSRQWGIQSAGDVPLVGDIEGDGKADLIVWRGPIGKWYCLTSTSGYNPSNAVERTWGSQSTGDVPSLVDRDGDGIADIAVWRASTGTWYWLKSSTGFTAGLSKQWGISTDVPIVK